MAHYAFLDENNIVTEVIIGIDETELIEGLDPETWYGNFRGQKCIRTSYNGNIRKNFASIGYFYDKILDIFIPPQPFKSWILDEEKFIWKPPFEKPDNKNIYVWNEDATSWMLIENI
jgi:predicted HTH transcriptional regulator